MSFFLGKLLGNRARPFVIGLGVLVALAFGYAWYHAGGIPQDGGRDHWNPLDSKLLGAMIVTVLFGALFLGIGLLADAGRRILEEEQAARRREPQQD